MSTRAGYAGRSPPADATRERTGGRPTLRTRHRGVDGVSSQDAGPPRAPEQHARGAREECRRTSSAARQAQRRLQRQLERREAAGPQAPPQPASSRPAHGPSPWSAPSSSSPAWPTTARTPPPPPRPAAAPSSAPAAPPTARRPSPRPCTYTHRQARPAPASRSPPAPGSPTTGAAALTMSDQLRATSSSPWTRPRLPAPRPASPRCAQELLRRHPPATGGDRRRLKVLQCGDPMQHGAGGPGYTLADPGDRLGDLRARARWRWPTAARAPTGRQFFLVFGDSTLPPNYTVFGKVDDAGSLCSTRSPRTGTRLQRCPRRRTPQPVTVAAMTPAA